MADRSPSANPFTFTGRWLDDESGLMYYRGRIYNPTLGRFVQQDPMGALATVPTELTDRGAAFHPVYSIPGAQEEYGDGLNLYQYVGSRPLILTDPTGRFVLLDLAASSGIRASLYYSSLAAGVAAGMASQFVVDLWQGMSLRNAAIDAAIFGAEAFAMGILAGEALFIRAGGLFFSSGVVATTGARVLTHPELATLMFSPGALKGMARLGRIITRDTVELVLKAGTRIADPQGVANTWMYRFNIYSYGRLREIDVLWNADANAVWHVLMK